MNTLAYSMDCFSVGDYVVFERSYSHSDFVVFSGLSGDTNPLHHDATYAEHSQFGQPIVPLHVTLSPLSMIAGMVFPGEPSLYLGHEVRAARAVYYGESLRYSARIHAVNPSHRVLSLRVLALRGSEVVLDAEMRVQSHAANWSTPPALTVIKGSQPALAVITGASGEIGGAIAQSLGKQGWHLLLQDRGDGDRRRHLQNQLSRIHADANFVSADLATTVGRDALAAAIASFENVGLVVHAASPEVTAQVEELVAVNFSALKQIIDVSLPRMLARQKAAVVLIGSSATEYALPGWETYAGAKSMAANLMSGVDRQYSAYGVRGLTMMPGLVATRFSSAYRKEKPALLPQEVADALLRMIADDHVPSNVVMLEPERQRRGYLGFRDSASTEEGIPSALSRSPNNAKDRESEPELTTTSQVADILRKSLRLADGVQLGNAGLGITPGWDSLKHIEILLEIEAVLGISFSSEEMETTHDIANLDKLCRKKLAMKGQK